MFTTMLSACAGFREANHENKTFNLKSCQLTVDAAAHNRGGFFCLFFHGTMWAPTLRDGAGQVKCSISLVTGRAFILTEILDQGWQTLLKCDDACLLVCERKPGEVRREAHRKSVGGEICGCEGGMGQTTLNDLDSTT